MTPIPTPEPTAPRLRVVQVLLKPTGLTETFLRANAKYLPADVTIVHSWIPSIGDRPVLSQGLGARTVRKLSRAFMGQPWEREVTNGYRTAFRRAGADVVLAEFGPAGVRVMEACRLSRIPLVVHFHGYDASVESCLNENADAYPAMFEQASALVAVSHAMAQKLVALGARPEKVHYRPSGVDCSVFAGAKPDRSPPIFIAVGRFIEKKAPHLTLLAFAEVHKLRPSARLRMIGTGPLLSVCQDLASALRLEELVTFMGPQPQAAVCEELRQARAFVQHSMRAANGDSEGTPNSVMEASACGLPVVATRHGGIPDVVQHGETGFLVEERDVRAMAQYMVDLVDSPELARRMGAAGRERTCREFCIEMSIGRLMGVLQRAVGASHTKGGGVSVPGAQASSP